MLPNFSTTQVVRKTVIETPHGVVASQHSLASRVGAEVLAAGGDAVDAAIATGFALGVVEPWMSGPAGGGATTLWRADEGRAYALNFGMRSPAALDVADYPLTGGPKASDLFPWPAVLDDRNMRGATAVAVPGMVDGMGKLHERFGTMPWAELLAPATGMAREGLLLDWFASLLIASAARNIARDADLAALFLEDGTWPRVGNWAAATLARVDMSGMAATLDGLAAAGARDFYEGDIARALVGDVQAKGGCLSMDDLSSYAADWRDTYSFARGDTQFHVQPGLTAGPTFGDIFARLPRDGSTGLPDAGGWKAMADALKGAYEHRIATMGHDGEAPTRPGCTTHFSVVDRHGNMVAHTQTLLSLFGSCVLSPSTGLPLNNGVMWFDPEQGKPNSLAPGQPCLMNICPAIGITPDGGFAFGASGGRKIVGAVAQLSHYVADRGMSLEEAFHAPRIDQSGALLVADDTIPADVLETLAAEYEVIDRRRTSYPFAWACTSGVMRRGGMNSGCTEIMSPWGDALSEADVA